MLNGIDNMKDGLQARIAIKVIVVDVVLDVRSDPDLRRSLCYTNPRLIR